MTRSPLHESHHPRSGAALIAAMVCVLVVTMVTATMVRTAVLQRKGLRDHARRMQADWLAEAGLERGLAALRADADYEGETWAIPASELDGRNAGRVTIEVTRQPDETRVAATADFPAEATSRARASRRRAATTDDE